MRPLRRAGFRKEGRTFRRVRSACTEVVNVQVSQWSSRDALSFTINLGVFFPEVQRGLEGYLALRLGQGGPKEFDCQVRTRLGALMPEASDKWWKLRAPRGPSPRPGELGDALTTLGLPWLERMTVPEEARCCIESWAPTQAMGFHLAAGELQLARALLREILKASPENDALRRWAEGRGLL